MGVWAVRDCACEQNRRGKMVKDMGRDTPI